jgi:hypothetical protein
MTEGWGPPLLIYVDNIHLWAWILPPPPPPHSVHTPRQFRPESVNYMYNVHVHVDCTYVQVDLQAPL